MINVVAKSKYLIFNPLGKFAEIIERKNRRSATVIKY